MTYQIVFVDVDGTLVNEEKQIPRDALEALTAIQKRGIEVVIASGRAPYFFDQYREALGVDSYVSLNGSFVTYKGQILYEHEIPRPTLAKLQERADERLHPIVYQGASACFVSAKDHPHVIESFDSLKVVPPRFNSNYWQEAKIYQALLYTDSRYEEAYREEFPNLSFVRWHRHAMDVVPQGGSKAKGIEAVLRHTGMSPADAVAFGDGLNDCEMLAYVGMGIAMGNAHDRVKPYAKFTTTDVNEGGIAHGLKQIGLL